MLEVMVVIFLISLIAGVVGYNLKGSMDKGKVFRSKQGREKLHDLLLLCAEDSKQSLAYIVKHPRKCLETQGMVKNLDETLKDGWGKPYKLSLNAEGTDIEVISEELAKRE